MAYLRLDHFIMNQKEFKIRREEIESLRQVYSKCEKIYYELQEQKFPKEKQVNQPNKPSSTPKKPPLYLELYPHNSKLNLAFLSKTGECDKEKRQEVQKLFRRLLDLLYESFLFYEKLKNNPSFFDELYASFIPGLQEKGAKVEAIEELACIVFNDPGIRESFLKMLKGEGCPCLLHFIMLEKNRRKMAVNIHFTPYEILAVIFQNKDVALKIVEKRQRYYDFGKRFTKSHKKSLVTDQYLTKEEVMDLLKEHKIDFQQVEPLLDFNVSRPSKQSMAKYYPFYVDAKGRLQRLSFEH